MTFAITVVGCRITTSALGTQLIKAKKPPPKHWEIYCGDSNHYRGCYELYLAFLYGPGNMYMYFKKMHVEIIHFTNFKSNKINISVVIFKFGNTFSKIRTICKEVAYVYITKSLACLVFKHILYLWCQPLGHFSF